MTDQTKNGLPLMARVEARVDRTLIPGCHIFTGRTNHGGYGMVWDGAHRKQRQAHRAVYEALVGPIPAGLQLDHLCRNRACVNPTHLEHVTAWENTMRGEGPAAVNMRKDECIRGHPFSPKNTYTYRGKRSCRTCKNLRAKWKRNPSLEGRT